MARALALLAIALALSPAAARPERKPAEPTAAFDRPLAVRPAVSAPGGLKCTYYADLMIREAGVDSPAPDAATLVPVAGGSGRPACDGARGARDVTLETQESSFVGRKGPFLLFQSTDPNGAVPFLVIQSGTGGVILRDGTAAGAFQSATLEGGNLRLRFRRGVNASCSIAEDAGACWATMAREGQIPPDMALSPPPARGCAAAYRKARAPVHDPSVIAYDVDMTVGMAGDATLNSHGAVGCDALP